MVCTPVCARVLFLATFVAKSRLRKFSGGRQRPDTAAPERGLWGWLRAPGKFCLRQSARRPVLENEFGQNSLVLSFVSVFDSLWLLFVFLFVLFCGDFFCDCVS